MSVLLVAASITVWWWPVTRAEYRFRRIAAVAPTTHVEFRRWPLVIAVPVVALLLSGPATAVAAAIAAAMGVRWVRRREAGVAHQREVEDLLTALSVMTAELSVGVPPVRACAAAADELQRKGSRGSAPDAIAERFGAMAARVELGGRMVADADTGDAPHRVAGAWQTADQYGLPLGDLLDAVRSDLVARRGFADRTRAGLAGPRATAAVLAGLPAVGVALGEFMGAHPVRILLGGGLGGVLLVVGTGLAAAGLIWSDRIVDRVARAPS